MTNENVMNDVEDLKNNMITETAEGTSIDITDSANARIRDLKIYGDINQNEYEGYNLWGRSSDYSETASSITIKYDKKTGIFTLNGTNSSTNNQLLSVRVFDEGSTDSKTFTYKFEYISGNITLADESYPKALRCMIKCRPDYSSSDSIDYDTTFETKTKTATVQGKNGFQFVIMNNQFKKGDVFDNFKFRILCIEGSSLDGKTFEPYTGEEPSPSIDFPQDVETVTGDVTIKSSDENNNEKEATLNFEEFELCSKDEYLYRNKNKWYKHKVYDKIESYSDEEIETDYISTTGELSEGATVYYKIDEADEEITDETLIKQLNKLYNMKTYQTTTSIYTETDNLEPTLNVTYVADLKTYIDNKISEIST